MISLSIHDVARIIVRKPYKLINTGDFVKTIIIESEKGEISEIDLFSNSEQKLKGVKS